VARDCAFLEDVPCGSIVGDDGGVYRHGDVTSTNAYTFGVGEHGWVVDAEFHGNLLRYVNDPCGTGRAANVRARHIAHDGALHLPPWMWQLEASFSWIMAPHCILRICFCQRRRQKKQKKRTT